ncbi:MAG: hypothetical protein AAF541_19840 [Pseudomonadota bacterium]
MSNLKLGDRSGGVGPGVGRGTNAHFSQVLSIAKLKLIRSQAPRLRLYKGFVSLAAHNGGTLMIKGLLSIQTFAAGVIIIVALTASPPTYAVAEQVQACQDAVENFDDSVEQALDDARWCVEQLEQMIQDQQADEFKEEVADYTRGEVEKQKMMGMSTIIATYTKSGNDIQVTRMGVGDGANPLSALAGFAQLGGGRKMRIGGNTGTLLDQGGEARLTLTMQDGSTLMFESRDVKGNEITDFAREFLAD